MQSKEDNSVCMLCLKLSPCALEEVKAVTMEMLKSLGLGLDLDVIGMAAICKTCSGNLEKCFDFKTVCLYTEDCINSFKDDRNNVKLDLREIYLKKNENANVAACKYNPICRLCMEIVETEGGMFLSDETKNVLSAKTILRGYFSELDLDITENPVICTSCNESLHTFFNFITNRFEFEDTMKQYCAIDENCDKPQVKLKSGLQFGVENISNYENGCTSVDIYKNCSESELYDENKLKPEHLVKEEFQELHIKCEINEHTDADDFEVQKLSNLLKERRKDKLNDETELKDESFVEAKRHEFNIKQEQIDIKTEQCDVTFEHLGQDTETRIAAYSCEMCTYKTKQKSSLKMHMLIHKNYSEITTYSCGICTYKAKRKHNLDRHMLIHKNVSEIIMYSCDICTYRTKRSGDLQKHLKVVHTPGSEITYQCDVCIFKTRHKWALKQHVIIHKNASDVMMYSCEICTYKAKRKEYLKKHMLIHKTASEVTIYRCDLCTFKTRHKRVLKQHVLIHKNASEVTTYQCDVCTFKTRYKRGLEMHVLIHKNNSEVTTYQCDVCTFKTRHKQNLKKHMLNHKTASEVTIYHCDICTFKSRHKRDLKMHVLLTHVDDSEVTIYHCDVCTFKTRYKQNLKGHMLVHKNGSEITMYPCEMCTYKAKRRGDLNRHLMLVHKTASKVA